GEMHRAGIVAVSDDGRPVMDAGLMRRALEYTSMFGLPLIVHEEEANLAAGGVMNEGVTALRLGLHGIPAAAEEVMLARDIALVELTGGRLHVAHVSTAGSVALLRDAKARGLAVTAEVTPHHLFLTEEAVAGYGTNAKMAPPLRNARDIEALRAALADGTIDALATDHAPHHHDEKEVEFEQAANGVVGLETALPLALRLVADGVLDLPALVARMTVGPARILGLRYGVSRPRLRRGGRGRGRARLQHQHDRVPGDPDRPVVRGAARGDDVPGDRQRRREPRGRRVAPAVRARLRRARVP